MQSSSRSTVAKASVMQKGNQVQRQHARHHSDSAGEREYTAYVNTHVRRAAYNPPPSSSSSSSQPQAAAASGWDEEDDEDEDDEQGAQWEEWSSERRNEWMEGRLRDFFPAIQSQYVLPTAGRVDSSADVTVWEGAAGVAYTFFHTAIKIIRALPPDSLSLTQTPVAKARRLEAERSSRPSQSPGGRVRDLTVPSPSSSEQTSSPRATAAIRAEQQLHSQRQHCIALLQHAYDYIQYCLHLVDEQQGEKAADSSSSSSNLCREDRKQIRSCDSRISFIRGRAGIFSLAACIHHHRARYLLLHPNTRNLPSPHFDPQSCLQQRADSISKLLQERRKSEEGGSEVDDEFFNGRAGFLFALNFVHSHLTGEVERMEAADAAGAGGGSRASEAGDDDRKDQPAPTEQSVMDAETLKRQLADVRAAIHSVHQQLIARGKQHDNSSVLHYSWQEKEYYGAAHGTAGILHALLQSPASILKPSLPIILSTASFLLSQRLPSGNLPSSAASTSDRLVQWCHGAPALCLLCSSLYAVTRDRQWLQAALESAEVVWQRGLLKKGVGLCHGISGNGYSFLTLYQLTRDDVHLHRAYHFAHFAMSDHHLQLMKQPDRPYSLYNGLAGLVCFCVDIEQSKRTCPSFPGYQLLDWGMATQD